LESGQRRVEWLALEPFDHLRTARAEAQDEAIIADRGHRQRCHRGHCGHPRADLHDAGAKPDTVCSCGEIGERRNRIMTPCLRGPDRIYAELFRFDHVFDLFVEVAPLARRRAADPDAYFHPNSLLARIIVEKKLTKKLT